ncbi:MAG: transposase zinc-binding domain-containing protein [Rubripirellula sp.]
MLRRWAAKFMRWDKPVAQIKSVLSKILLCRTSILKGHVYKCTGCDSKINVYNSCGDRHCPQCGGARRADWMNKSAEVIVQDVPYFQVVFTMPDKLSALILGNRAELYSLLMQSAWRALDGELRRTARYQPAALMVLHT